MTTEEKSGKLTLANNLRRTRWQCIYLFCLVHITNIVNNFSPSKHNGHQANVYASIVYTFIPGDQILDAKCVCIGAHTHVDNESKNMHRTRECKPRACHIMFILSVNFARLHRTHKCFWLLFVYFKNAFVFTEARHLYKQNACEVILGH